MMPDHCSRLHSAFPRLGATTGRDECQLGGQEHGPTAGRRATPAAGTAHGPGG